MLKREILLTSCAIVLALSGQEAKAAEACTATPTCAELGYTDTSCDSAYISLKCPFDKNKLFCVDTPCASGYAYNLVTGECGVKNQNVIYSSLGTPVGVKISSNLAVAMTNEGQMTWYNAVAKCKAKTTGGKSWRLPTKDELVAINQNYQSIVDTLSVSGGDGFIGTYWSSTEYSSTHAWAVRPDNGFTHYYPKTDTTYVRCVFAF